MQRLFILTPILWTIALAGCSAKHDGAAVTVRDPWVRVMAPGQLSTGGYMELKSQVPAKLLKVTSPLAETIEVHRMEVKEGVMRMEPVLALELPAGEAVRLAPGGYHLMLSGVREPLAVGGEVPLQLILGYDENKTAVINIRAPVLDKSGRRDQ